MVWRSLVIAIAIVVAAPSLAADDHGVPLPPRSPRIGESHYRSSRGFRQTVRYYQHWLKRAATPVTEVPVYSYRGVTVARFVSRAAAGSWRAIHVFVADGLTQIVVVPRPSPAPEPSR